MTQPQAAAPIAEQAGALLDLYRTMTLIRALDLRIRQHIDEQGFGGFWHSGIGQEGIQVGAIAPLHRDDCLFYAHRGLGYAVAKGMSLHLILGDVLGRSIGSTGGKGGGTVHFVDLSCGVMGQGGTLGSSFPLGAGAAVSAQLQGVDRVCAVFFGDGAASRGTFHEAALQAAAWKLPVIWVCENNGWAISVPIREQSPTPDIATRAAAYGMPGIVVDGQDVVAVYEAMTSAIERARNGCGPTLIEAKTVRVRGHYEGDQQKYRDDLGDGSDWRDPLAVLRVHLDPDDADSADREASTHVDEIFAEVLAAPKPHPDIVFEHVW